MLNPRLAHVVAVARAGSFMKAADAVGVTQSAVTKSVAGMEQQLGYALFHRTARGALLTEEGRDFVERAARLLDDARDLMDPQARQDAFSGVLRIGVTPPSIEWLTAPAIAALAGRRRGVRVQVTAGRFEGVVQLLRTGGVDVAVGFDAGFAEWRDLRRAPLAALEVALFVRAGHPILALPERGAAELSAYTFVSPSDSRPYGEAIRGLYESRGLDWRRHVHVVDFFPSVRELVASTDAIGVVAQGIGAQLSDAFVRLDAAAILPEARMCCAVRARIDVKPAVRAFIGEMQRLRPAPEGALAEPEE